MVEYENFMYRGGNEYKWMYNSKWNKQTFINLSLRSNKLYSCKWATQQAKTKKYKGYFV